MGTEFAMDGMKENRRKKACDIKRILPPWAKVVKRINGLPIYNMSVYENILSWNRENQSTPAMDYYGRTITYGELPECVNEYICGFRKLGITAGKVVTLCLPVSIENLLSLFALDCIGAVANSVNILFLKSDVNLYTTEKGSDVLIILDAYLPKIVDSLKNSGIREVIVTSLSDYLPEDNRHVFDDMSSLPENVRNFFDDRAGMESCPEKMAKLTEIRFTKMSDVIRLGRENLLPFDSAPVDIERDSEYSYTSGTTGTPKCIVFKEESTNAFIEMHVGLDLKDYVGERVFQVIPLTHATGERVSCFLQMARGKTLVLNPIYNKESFGADLKRTQCNWILAAPSFYLAAIDGPYLGKDALACVTRPTSGGEPVTKSNVKMIDDWLGRNGCGVRFAIGGGAAEDGSGTFFTYFMNDETKTNETGIPLEPYIRAGIVDETGRELPQGKRGYLIVTSPASADRYLNDEKATKNRWFMDENGTKWGITGDIAVKNPDGSYNILGRSSDSYTDEKGEIHYLFDIEYSLDAEDPVLEWEINAHRAGGKFYVCAQVVLKKEQTMSREKIVRMLCRKYGLDAVKFYEKFESSPVTGKRDYKLLKNDKQGYYAPVPHTEDDVYRLDFEEEHVEKHMEKCAGYMVSRRAYIG